MQTTTANETDSDEENRIRDFMQLLRIARLCQLQGSLPTNHNKESQLQLNWDTAAPPIACAFTCQEKKHVYKVRMTLPPNCQPLSLVAADLKWDNPERFLQAMYFDVSDNSSGLWPKPSGWLFRRSNGWDVANFNVEGYANFDIRTFSLQMCFPLPILIKGFAADDTMVAEEIRIVSYGGEQLKNVFATHNKRVHRLAITPLASKDVHQLRPVQAGELLGGLQYEVRLLEPVNNSTVEYTVDLSDSAAQERLNSQDVALALQIAYE